MTIDSPVTRRFVLTRPQLRRTAHVVTATSVFGIGLVDNLVLAPGQAAHFAPAYTLITMAALLWCFVAAVKGAFPSPSGGSGYFVLQLTAVVTTISGVIGALVVRDIEHLVQQPWPLNNLTLAMCLSALWGRRWLGRLLAIQTAAYLALRVPAIGWVDGFLQAMISVTAALGLTLFGVVVAAVAARVEEQTAQSHSARERATAARHREDARQWWAGVLHDKVLGALLLGARASTTESRSAGAELATKALAELAVGPMSIRSVDDQERIAALVSYVAQLDVRVSHAVRHTGTLPSTVAEATIGAVHEAVTNVSRHARGSRVHIGGTLSSTEMHLAVIDDGPGFDLDQVPEDRHGLRDGLIDRFARIDGLAEITSAAGQGTRVDLYWPAASAPRLRQDHIPSTVQDTATISEQPGTVEHPDAAGSLRHAPPAVRRVGHALAAVSRVLAPPTDASAPAQPPPWGRSEFVPLMALVTTLILLHLALGLRTMDGVHSEGLVWVGAVCIGAVTIAVWRPLEINETLDRFMSGLVPLLMMVLAYNCLPTSSGDFRYWFVGATGPFYVALALRTSGRIASWSAGAGVVGLMIGVAAEDLAALGPACTTAVQLPLYAFIGEVTRRTIAASGEHLALQMQAKEVAEADTLREAARAEVRRRRVADLDGSVSHLLARVASDEELTDEERAACLAAEASTRDLLGAATLVTADVSRELAHARAEGTQVTLTVTSEVPDAVVTAARDLLLQLLSVAGPESTVTVRLLGGSARGSISVTNPRDPHVAVDLPRGAQIQRGPGHLLLLL